MTNDRPLTIYISISYYAYNICVSPCIVVRRRDNVFSPAAGKPLLYPSRRSETVN